MQFFWIPCHSRDGVIMFYCVTGSWKNRMAFRVVRSASDSASTLVISDAALSDRTTSFGAALYLSSLPYDTGESVSRNSLSRGASLTARRCSEWYSAAGVADT